MQMTLRQQAEPGVRFDARSLAALVGTSVPVNLGAVRKVGTVVAAEAVENGGAMDLTVRVPDDADTAQFERLLSPQLSPFSIGLKP